MNYTFTNVGGIARKKSFWDNNKLSSAELFWKLNLNAFNLWDRLRSKEIISSKNEKQKLSVKYYHHWKIEHLPRKCKTNKLKFNIGKAQSKQTYDIDENNESLRYVFIYFSKHWIVICKIYVVGV